jgi:hypothetical protein
MPEFQGNSDKEETFKFASMLLEAGWMDTHAFVNGAATLQVRTLYVAHGSKIKVTIKDKEAKALETVEGFVYADFFRKKVALTAAHAPGIFFEAELPDHGLKAIGQKLIVKPAIRVYEPTWKDKATGKAVTEIKRGMDLQIEAKTENLPDGADARIVIRERHGDHDGAHDVVSIPVQVQANKLSLLWRFEYPQDTLQFASKDERGRTQEKYAPPKILFEAWAYGACAKAPAVDFIDFVVVEATDSAGNPVPDQKVKITLPDGTKQEATTDSEGLVKVAATKPGQVDVELVAQAPPADEDEAGTPAAKPQEPIGFILKTSPWPASPVTVAFTPNASLESCLQPKLDAHPPFKKAIKDKKLCFAVADLAHGGARYFGVNDKEQWNTASLAKIATMAAAFYLKAAVDAAAKEIAADATASAEITTDKKLFKALNKAWDPLIKAKFPRRAFTPPRLDHIFSATDTGSGWDIQFKEIEKDSAKIDAAHNHNGKIDKLGFKERMYLMVAFSDNWAAHTCIDDLGFNYIGGALQDAGFYDGDKTGFWTRSNYNGVKWGPAIGSGQAEAVCRFLCALQLGTLVDKISSNAMLALMEKAPNSSGIGSWILGVLPDSPDELYSKVGVWNGHYSEGVVVNGATVGGTAFKYALIIYQHLGGEEFMIETLAPEIHKCLT